MTLVTVQAELKEMAWGRSSKTRDSAHHQRQASPGAGGAGRQGAAPEGLPPGKAVPGPSEGALGIPEDKRSPAPRSTEGMGRGEHRAGRELDFPPKNDGNHRPALTEQHRAPTYTSLICFIFF